MIAQILAEAGPLIAENTRPDNGDNTLVTAGVAVLAVVFLINLFNSVSRSKQANLHRYDDRY